MSFPHSLDTLLRGLDAQRHQAEIARLQTCRAVADLDAIVDEGGWLTPAPTGKRLKLVRHGSGTYLVVEYDDGWSTRVSQAAFR